MSALWKTDVAPHRKISRIFFWRKGLVKNKKFIFDFATTNAEVDELEPSVNLLKNLVHSMVTSSFLSVGGHLEQSLYRI